MILKTYKITISGQVQGVGFRPYVYSLVSEFDLTGTVSNNEEGVIIFVTGQNDKILNFYHKLINFPPPVSRIKTSEINSIDIIPFKKFKIIPSKKGGQLNLSLTPDFAICEDCQKDIINSGNRRFYYPFTTCVNCGPRWAITETFPFEREHTSIDDFPMCDECTEEYTNPVDRRFHSQTNTCKTCGIDLFLTDNKGEKLNVSRGGLFKKVVSLLSEGNIIAIKNTSGYLLCCDAENEKVVQKLRSKKNRPTKPFAILYPSLNHLINELNLDEIHVKSLTSTERPINIVSLDNYRGKIALSQVAPGLRQLGVMLPYTGILQLLVNELSFPIVATSGNIHSSPIINKNEEAIEKLKDVADYFMQHNLRITHPQDDSVIKYSFKYNQEVLFRRSRGYAPNYFNIEINTNEKIMAMGAHLKSSVAFYPNEFLYLSEYLGNLDNYDVYNRYVATAESFIDIFELPPKVILVDKHPSYESTKFGKEIATKYGAKFIRIQHHKAHFTAILAEHDLFDKKVLGVIFDGTGFGDDGQIWGGEFFELNNSKIKRKLHVTYFDWLLGDKMSKEPRLSLLSLTDKNTSCILKKKFNRNELMTYKKILHDNKLKTSSVGRLFDAVASVLDITDFNTYEGEAPILLENYVSNYNLDECKSYLSNPAHKLDAKEIIFEIYKDLEAGVQKEKIIANFLFTLANCIVEFAKFNKYEHLAFSGGVFQNTTLVDLLIELAPKEIKLYFHKNLSPNDENISFGQIMHYLNIK